MGHAARRMKVALPADVAVAAEVDLGTGEGGYFLQARLAISLPCLAPEVARALVARIPRPPAATSASRFRSTDRATDARSPDALKHHSKACRP